MIKKSKHKVNATTPRLSDEDIDPIEKDDVNESYPQMVEGWLPWEPEDISDIRRLIAESLPPKQQFILESFLDGLSYSDINVTEKYWRYHFAKGIEFIKQELKL
jgi:DNA-directed RNA polymerase specialized sigma24 family protein